MKKRNSASINRNIKKKGVKTSERIKPEEALEFLSSFQKMIADQNEVTKSISIRVPENILRALKIKAKAEDKKYQSLIISAIREYLKK